MREEAFRKRRGEYDVEYRILGPEGEVRWIESRSFIAFNADGRPRRVLGVNLDVTERKQTERALADRNKQLELAGKVAGVGTFAINVDAGWENMAQTIQISPGFAAIYGFPDETVKISVGDWRSRVFPADLAQFLTIRHKAFAEQRSESQWEYEHSPPNLVLEWREIGGPPVVAPDKPSYGISIIRGLLPYECSATVDLVLASDGVRCKLEFPLTGPSNVQPDQGVIRTILQ